MRSMHICISHVKNGYHSDDCSLPKIPERVGALKRSVMVRTIKGETATLLFCERRSSLEMLGWELEKKLLSCLNRQFRRETGERLVVALHVVDSNLLLDCRRQTQPPFWPLI